MNPVVEPRTDGCGIDSTAQRPLVDGQTNPVDPNDLDRGRGFFLRLSELLCSEPELRPAPTGFCSLARECVDQDVPDYTALANAGCLVAILR